MSLFKLGYNNNLTLLKRPIPKQIRPSFTAFKVYEKKNFVAYTIEIIIDSKKSKNISIVCPTKLVQYSILQ